MCFYYYKKKLKENYVEFDFRMGTVLVNSTSVNANRLVGPSLIIVIKH